MEQGDLRCDKTLPSLPPPTPTPPSARTSARSERTVTALPPTPELTLAATRTSRPSSQPQSQAMDHLAPEPGPRRHSEGMQGLELVYLKPTRNSLSLRRASFVMKPGASSDSVPRPRSLKPVSLKPASSKAVDQNKRQAVSVKTNSKDVKPKPLRPTSLRPTLKPSSIKTVPVMNKRKPISLRSEDLVAIPGSKPSKPKPSRPELSSKPKTRTTWPSEAKNRGHSLKASSNPPPETVPAAAIRPARTARAVDEEERKLERISKLIEELEVESRSDEDEIRGLFEELRRVRQVRKGLEAPT